jgi:hypothetical protein
VCKSSTWHDIPSENLALLLAGAFLTGCFFSGEGSYSSSSSSSSLCMYAYVCVCVCVCCYFWCVISGKTCMCTHQDQYGYILKEIGPIRVYSQGNWTNKGIFSRKFGQADLIIHDIYIYIYIYNTNTRKTAL